MPTIRRHGTTTPFSRLAATLVAGTTALTLATAVLLLGPPAGAAAAATYGNGAVTATNSVRKSHDLRTLRSDRCLERFAVRQAERMATQRRMFHQDIGVPLRRCHLRSVGENVAEGYGSGTAVVRQGWMRSAPHRANILHPSFRIVAVAARRGSDGQWYASQVLARR